MLYLNPEFERYWRGRDPFVEASALQGKIYREVKNRRTLRFEIDGKGYFLKLHEGVGWLEIAKNLLLLRLPVVGAENEWRAIRKLAALGIDTMEAVAYGSRGLNPARRRSFLVTRELPANGSLEDLCGDWRTHPPPVTFKRRLIDQLAGISRLMHTSGVCHRDFYLCHFLLQEAGKAGDVSAPRLFLIDLHRALIRRRLGQRWIVKDIAGLYFSSMDAGLTRRDLLRFMVRYRDRDLRSTLLADRAFWKAVEKRGQALYTRLGNPRGARA